MMSGKHSCRRKFLLYCTLMISHVLLFGQRSHIKFDKISLEDGLSQSSVFCIAQDAKGFMWFATLDGLNKYDGYNMTIFRNNPKDSSSLPDNNITDLYVDLQGTLWIGTRSKGFCRYDPIKSNFTTFQSVPDKPNTLSNNTVNSMIEDNDGNLWIGTANGLNKYDRKNDKYTYYNHSPQNPNSLSSNYITKIIKGYGEYFWIGTDHGVNRFNYHSGKNDRFVHDLSDETSLCNNFINSLCIDKVGNLWVATRNGLAKLNSNDEKFTTFHSDPDDNFSLLDNSITSLLEDKNGTLWIGTEEGGINRLDPESDKFISYNHDPAISTSLSVDNILCLYQDKTNILWVGTSLGGINKWNRAAEDLSVFRHNPYDPNSLSSNMVRCIFEDSSGDIWIGTVNGGLNLWDKELNTFIHYKNNPADPYSISQNHVRTIMEDSKGNLWIGTDGGGINIFDRKTGKFTHIMADFANPDGLSSNSIWKIFEDEKGYIWIATFGGGLNMYNQLTKKFTFYRHDSKKKTSLSDDNVTTIYQDHKGVLWFGTYGGGLNSIDEKLSSFNCYRNTADSGSLGHDRIYCIMEDNDRNLWVGTKGSLNKFNRTTGKFKKFTEANGFPNDVMMGIVEDDVSNLWISTNKGLVRFNLATEKARNYDVRDGLQGNEFLVGAYCKTKAGELLFGGVNGFNAFFPQNIKDNPHPPEIVITGFKIFNKEIPLDSSISEKKIVTLSYKDYNFSFEFVALDYIFPEKNQYAYYMQGFDADWNQIGTRRFANYTNLPPARYVFKVKGSNNDQVWNEEGTSIIVIIEPAFWQTLWFKIVCILTLILTVITVFWVRVRNINRRNEHLERVVKERTAELMQQKEETIAQRDEIEAQRDDLEKQRDIANQQRDFIASQKKEITDSIKYAKRIQTATIPSEDVFKKELPGFFVFFRPKDIVSGDFWWAWSKDNLVVVAAADCTGHGVPGAFMSMLGVSHLNEIIKEKKIHDPGEILNLLRTTIIESFKHESSESDPKDGMDIALCVIDTNIKKLAFAGANNPLYHIRNNELNIIEADDMPVGLYDKMDPFTTKVVEYKEGDNFFIFSDGYADQFGGDKNKKFKYGRFREMLLKNAQKPMKIQQLQYERNFDAWKGNYEQVDDILLIGIRM